MVIMTPEYRREYYEKNKEKIKEHMRQKVLCTECDVWITRNTVPKHKLSNKHISNAKLMAQIQQMKNYSINEPDFDKILDDKIKAYMEKVEKENNKNTFSTYQLDDDK